MKTEKNKNAEEQTADTKAVRNTEKRDEVREHTSLNLVFFPFAIFFTWCE